MYAPAACVRCHGPRPMITGHRPERGGMCQVCEKELSRTPVSWQTQLARVIRNQPGRTPLRLDPALYAAFAEDRETAA